MKIGALWRSEGEGSRGGKSVRGGGIVKGGAERGSAAGGEPAEEGGGRWVRIREVLEWEREVRREGEEGGDCGCKKRNGGASVGISGRRV